MMRLIAFLFAVLLLAPAPAAAQDAAYEKRLREHPFYDVLTDTATRTPAVRDMLEFIDSGMTQDPATVPVVSLWLREHTIDEEDPAKVNSLYFATYSDTLLALAEGYRGAGAPDKYRAMYKTAMLNFFIFELMANVDAARCQDPTALAAIRHMVSDRVEAVDTAYKLFPRAAFDEIQKAALQQEEKYLSRPANLDVCSLGQARLIDLQKQQGVLQKTVQDQRFPGGERTVYIPPPGYKFIPAVMPDDEWIETRPAMLGEVTAQWAKRYAAAMR